MSGNGIAEEFPEYAFSGMFGPTAAEANQQRIEAKLDRILELLEKPKRERKEKKEEYPADFLLLWGLYPHRAGSNPKRKAYHALQARLKDGEPLQAIRYGVTRYRAYCVAAGIQNTEYVMQAARFFGPGREWENPWTIPEAEVKPKTDEEWLALGRKRGLEPRQGESWQSFKQRVQEA